MVSNFIKILDHNQDDKSLRMKLINILREHLNLRIQAKMGQLKQSHLLKIARRDVASIKYILSKSKDIYKK